MVTNQALKKLIVPLVVEQILVMLVGMADTAMVSYAGEAAISGVALVDIGVWIAMGCDWLARSVAFVVRYKSGKWKEFQAI